MATAGSVSEGSPVGRAGKALLWVLKEGGVYGGHWCWDMEELSRRADGFCLPLWRKTHPLVLVKAARQHPSSKPERGNEPRVHRGFSLIDF